MAENLLRYLRVVDDRYDPHDAAAFWAAQRVCVPHFANGKQAGDWRLQVGDYSPPSASRLKSPA